MTLKNNIKSYIAILIELYIPKCGSCNKSRLFISKRKYKVKEVKGYITSQNKLCGKCYRDIKSMIDK